MKKGLILFVLIGSVLGFAQCQVDFQAVGVAPEAAKFVREPWVPGSFRLLVGGVDREEGTAVILNLRTKEVVELGLVKGDDGLISKESLYLHRECDPLRPGTGIIAEAGDFLVVTVAWSDGPCCTLCVKTVPRSQPPSLYLERWAEDQGSWASVGKGDALLPGRYRVSLVYPGGDITCARESVDVEIWLGEEMLDLSLEEDAGASARFVGEFALEMGIEGTELMAKLTADDEELKVLLPAQLCLKFLHNGYHLEQCHPVKGLEIQVLPASYVVTMVGCPQTLAVADADLSEAPTWCDLTTGQCQKGWSLTFSATQETYPQAWLFRVIARKDAIFGQAIVAVTVVPKPHIFFANPGTGSELASASATGRITIRLTGVGWLDQDKVELEIGRLGPDPKIQRIAATRVGDFYQTEAFVPQDKGFAPGDVLWAQFCFPAETGCCKASGVLNLLQ